MEGVDGLAGRGVSIHQTEKKQKIAIRGDGKSPDQKVIDMQLQAANLVYIFNNVVLWML